MIGTALISSYADPPPYYQHRHHPSSVMKFANGQLHLVSSGDQIALPSPYSQIGRRQCSQVAIPSSAQIFHLPVCPLKWLPSLELSHFQTFTFTLSHFHFHLHRSSSISPSVHSSGSLRPRSDSQVAVDAMLPVNRLARIEKKI